MRDIEKISIAGLFWNLGILKIRSGYCIENTDIQKASLEILEECNLPFAKELSAIFQKQDLEKWNLLEKSNRYSYGFTEDEFTKKNKFIQPILLSTIFSEVGFESTINPIYYPLSQLSPEIIPIKENKNSTKEEYSKLYLTLIQSLKKYEFDPDNFNQSIVTYSSILERAITLVPSIYSNSLSLYDQSMSLSAIAGALYLAKGQDLKLIQGDFSGIQSFIFSRQGESNKHIAKTLRAKSFFVSTSTEIIAHRICNEISLLPTNIVMNAGGKFTILAYQNSPSIEQLKQEVKQEFEKLSYGQTKFILAEYSFSESQLEENKFSKVLSGLALEFEKQKLKYIPERKVYIGYVDDIAKQDSLCDICGIEPALESKENIGKLCRKFIEIGTNLTKHKYILLQIDDKPLEYSIQLKEKTITKIEKGFLLYEIDSEKPSGSFPTKRVANLIPHFTKEDVYSPIYDNLSEGILEGDIKTFEHIGFSALELNENEKQIGRDYLAAFKADIDNLGQLFINGFKKGKDGKPIKTTLDKLNVQDSSSLAKISSLSRFIDFFFTGWLRSIISKKYTNIYTIFAGGDDLFLIGNYKDIFHLTNSLITHLNEYAGKHPDIHFSSAVVLFKHKIPIYQIKDSVEEHLDRKSKKLKGKNAITVFGVPMKNEEYKVLFEKHIWYDQLITTEKVSTQYLYKLLTFIGMNEEIHNPKDGKIRVRDYMWRPLFSYHTFRLYYNQLKSKEEANKDIYGLYSISKDIENYRIKLAFPISIAIYKNRR